MPRLGQLLVRADLVSENNLARALGVQHFAGGRIGTLLLERGSVTEDDVGKMLAQQHDCEYVPWRDLADVPAVTIAALPAKFAIKHSAVPYARVEGSIKLVLRDPADLRILDELFFVTGRKIIAGVAPEVRIYQALEKYYGERRTPRFAILAEKLSRPVRGTRGGTSAPPPPPQFFPEPGKAERPLPEPQEIWGDASDVDLAAAPPIIQSWKVPDPHGGWAGTSSPKSPRGSSEVEAISWEEMPPSPSLWTREAPAGSSSSASPPAPVPLAEPGPAAPALSASRESAFRDEAVPVPAADSFAGPPAPEPLPMWIVLPPPPPGGPVESSAPPVPIAITIPPSSDFTAVAAATDRDAVAGAALLALTRRFPRAAIFAARPDAVAGWAAIGEAEEARVRALKIPWSEPSVFLNVRLSRSFYLGPLLKLPRHEELAAALGSWPEECAVQPVLIKDKPAAFLYVEAPRDGVSPMDLVYLRELAATMGSAFAAAIRLRKKEI